MRKRNACIKFLALWLALACLLSAADAALADSLAKGAKGEAVRSLQERLTALGYAPGKADGVYGNATYLAVLLFQSRNGLPMNGTAGESTLQTLYSNHAVGKTPGEAEKKPYVTEDGLPLLVNRDYPFPEGYVYYDLVVLNDYCDKSVVKIKNKNTLAEREAADALMKMLRAAKKEGIGRWQISEAFRTVEQQKKLLNSRISKNVKSGMSKKKARSTALKTVAEPGLSEHHLGTCFDITVPGVSFAGTKQHQWLLKHCWDYGFILRYPPKKTKLTGFSAEAWHYRYVGVEHAKKMKKLNLCLGEYVTPEIRR